MTRITLLFAVAWLAAACTLPNSSEPDINLGSVPDGSSASLVRVDDGDSFAALVDGQEQRVRLIGVNAPEQGECLADAARDRLRMLLDGRPLVLVEDVDPADRFGRLLRYVFVGDLFVNETLVAEGLAVARAFEPNTAQQEGLDAAERDAREQQLGIWDPEACGATEANLIIVDVVADPPGLDIEGEYVEIENPGPPVDLTGWVIRDETSQNRYAFPSGLVLATGDRIRVYTGCGTDGAAVAYWCSPAPVWDNTGDTAFLIGPSGSIRASFAYGG